MKLQYVVFYYLNFFISHILRSKQTITSQGGRIAANSSLKSCTSRLPDSNLQRFQLVLFLKTTEEEEGV